MKILLVSALPLLLAAQGRAQSSPATAASPPDDPLYHCFACKYPEYKEGGFEGLLRAIGRNTRYPPSLQQDGRVFVRFVIDEQGRVRNAAVVRSLQPDADSAAVRAVRQLGAFSPALDPHGRPIAVPWTVAIGFSQE